MDEDVQQNFLLLTAEPTINNILSRSFKTQKRFYEYYAPEDASPCEVYNFSVTATYVGATYTGVGCSEPSPVLSTMLPSLPNITGLESSLNYTLQKRSGKVILVVSYLVGVSTCTSQIVKDSNKNNIMALSLGFFAL